MPVLKELHWLPVQYRVLVHSIQHTGQPTDLRQLLQDYEHWSTPVNTGQPASFVNSCRTIYELVRSLRLSTKNLICKSAVGTVFATRGFRHSAVYVWNNLPDNIRRAKTCDIFKRKLKTHLCVLAFGVDNLPCLRIVSLPHTSSSSSTSSSFHGFEPVGVQCLHINSSALRTVLPHHTEFCASVRHHSLMSSIHSLLGLPLLFSPSMIPNTTFFINRGCHSSYRCAQIICVSSQ